VPEALAIGAQGPGTLKNFDELMADFKAPGHLHDRAAS